MEVESSLPHSQEFTDFRHKPKRFPTYFFKNHFNIILSSTTSCVQICVFYLRFLIKISVHFSSSPYRYDIWKLRSSGLLPGEYW
jgi:hypothetical protein